MEQKLVYKEFNYEANQKSQDLYQTSYEALKIGQIELVDMNKNLIMKHQDESRKLKEELQMLKAQLVDRSAKLRRYTEVVKTFDS